MQAKTKNIIKKSLIALGVLFLLFMMFGISVALYFLNLSLKRPSKGWTDPLVDGDFGYREPFKTEINLSTDWLHSLDYEDIYIKSFDGLKLHGKFYEQDKKAPVVIMMHGFHSSADFEFSGIYDFFYKEKGWNLLLCDQRAHGKSEGKYITFGEKEHKDCYDWIKFIDKKTEGDIYLMGISMGCSTVLMTLQNDLPENVKGVIADCGFTKPEEIVKKVVGKDYNLPAGILMPFLNFFAKTIGDADLNSFDTRKILKKTNIPVLFIHGDQDKYVPFYMSEENFEACNSKKMFFKTHAEHAASFWAEQKNYKTMLNNFIEWTK
ncbi:MAG: alpha/beta hydrolase [Treponema sp.]|nr:alpha/beta hydrolase [Treponema sp.]